MPIPSAYIYAGILLAVTLALALVLAGLPQIVGWMLGVQRPNKTKLNPYECGITPTGSARVRFSIKFYLVAMLFILFDIEAVFLYPWAVTHRWLGWFGMMEMGVFVAILLVGYVYIWKRGAFKWE
jgi:NADH-quinone oxidoreductase subunit A